MRNIEVNTFVFCFCIIVREHSHINYDPYERSGGSLKDYGIPLPHPQTDLGKLTNRMTNFHKHQKCRVVVGFSDSNTALGWTALLCFALDCANYFIQNISRFCDENIHYSIFHLLWGFIIINLPSLIRVNKDTFKYFVYRIWTFYAGYFLWFLNIWKMSIYKDQWNHKE